MQSPPAPSAQPAMQSRMEEQRKRAVTAAVVREGTRPRKLSRKQNQDEELLMLWLWRQEEDVTMLLLLVLSARRESRTGAEPEI